MYGRILIGRVRKLIDDMIGVEKAGFRPGRDCDVNKVLAIRQFVEKCLKMYVSFMDLKAHGRIDREAAEMY